MLSSIWAGGAAQAVSVRVAAIAAQMTAYFKVGGTGK